MKFFTFEVWAGFDKSQWPFQEYFAQLDANRERLPSWFLDPSFSLHDSHVRHLSIDVSERQMTLELSNSSRFTETDHMLGNTRLQFFDLQSFSTRSNPDRGFGGLLGFGDWGYEEIEPLDNGVLELRAIFSSGIEFEIRFKRFSAEWLETTESERMA